MPRNQLEQQLIKYELASIADSVAIARLCRDEIEHGLGWQYRPPLIKSLIRQKDTIVLSARDYSSGTPQLIGFGVMRYQLNTAHLILFAVTHEYRSQGIGQRLLNWLEKSARVAGISTIMLEVRSTNMPGRKFYEKRGYKYVRLLRDYYRRSPTVRENAWQMRKVLRNGRKT